MTDENANNNTTHLRPRRRRARLRQSVFSLADVARLLGRRPDALRRMAERIAVERNGELVAEIGMGIVLRKNKARAHWLATIPRDLRGEEAP
jgi:hypothetical protein